MAWFRRRDRDAEAVPSSPMGPSVVVTSPDGPTTSWPGRFLAGQTFATIVAPKAGAPARPREGLTVGGRQLPGILVPSRTDTLVAKALDNPPANGQPAVFVVRHDFLAGEERDQPSFLGLGARAMVFLNLSARLCPDLEALGAALQQDGARLHVHAHRTARFGFLRLNLLLPGLVHDIDTAVSPVLGDVQEFLAVAHQTGVIELHVSRESSDSTLSCACSTGALRPVVDRALAGLAGSAHPSNAAELDTFTVELRSALAAVNHELDPAAAISLTVADSAPSFVPLEVVI